MLSKKSSSEAVDAIVTEAAPRKVHPFFNRTLFFKNTTRFWPIWLCYTVIWAFALPIQILVEMIDNVRYGGIPSNYIADRTILTFTSDVGVPLSVLFGLLAAVAVFSYLFSARSAGLMHTLPIKREGLFFTNYLSGLCFLLVPNLLIALLTFAAESAAGNLNAWNIILWLLIQSGTAFFFFTFAVFCGMFTGNIIAMPAFYGIFNILALVISVLLDSVMNLFVFGYDGISWAETLVEWLTPGAKLINELRFRTVIENGLEVRLFTGFQYVLAYCGVAVVLGIAALYLYEARHMETAGDVIALPWAKPVFKFSFAFCAALCGGYVLYYTFRPLFDESHTIFTLFCVIAGVIGCLVAEMLLQKSFKVFRRGWGSTGIFCACLVLLLVGLSNDVMGLEGWVPNPDRVTAVSLNGSTLAPYDSGDRSNRNLNDQEDIEKVIALHQNIVNDRAFYKAFNSNLYTYGDAPVWEGHYIDLTYTMFDGSLVSRRYSIPFNVASNDPDPDTVEGLYLSLMGDTDYLLENYFPGEDLDARPVSGRLTVFNTEKRLFEDVEFNAQEVVRLAEAAYTDIRAGRLGVRYLSDFSEERRTNCSYHDLRLEWYYTVEETDVYAVSATDDKPTLKTESYSRTFSSRFTPQYTATTLMDTLRELGALDDTHVLLSHAEYEEITNTDADFGYYDPEYGYYK